MVAELQSPTEQPPLVNSAPLKPLLELSRGVKRPDSRIQKAIAELFRAKHQKDKDVFAEIANVGQLVSLYFNGQQTLLKNPYNGSWSMVPVRGDAGPRTLNVMGNLKQNLLTKWENSNPDIIIRAARNVNTAQSAAKSADAVNNFYERQFYNSWFTQQEGLMGMTFGTYIDRYRYDADKLSLTIMQDVFGTRDVTMGEGSGLCGDCGYGGTAAQFKGGGEQLGQLGGDGPLAMQLCPNCGSDTVDVSDPARDSLFSVTGREAKAHGDLVCELLPMPACRWDLARRPEDSSWFLYRQRIPKGAVTRVLGNVLIPHGNTESDNGLDVLRALNKQGAALQGSSQFGNQRKDEDSKEYADTCTFDELWLSPDDYADINLIGDEETVEGGRIEKGKLTDQFPDGLCAVGLNGMAVVLALYPERHRNHIVSGTWFMQSQTGAGRGLADTVEIQKQFNVMNNQARQYMAATYSPAVLYDKQMITGDKMRYIGTPTTNIPLDLTKLPEGKKLSDMIHQMQPTAMPAQFFNYAQNFLNVLFQKTAMVTDFSNGEPGITATNTTATAAEIDQGNADAINQPIFLNKADARKRGAELTIQLFRQHFPMKRYFDLGGEYGQQEGVELSGADLEADLEFLVVKNSEMPKGPFAKQKNRMQFFNVVGGIEGMAMAYAQFPKVLAGIAQDFDVDLEIGESYDGINELCLRRLGQMEEAEKVGVTDPSLLISAIQPPISAVELELQKKAEWFARWLSLDQGQNASMPLRAACEMLAQGQLSGAVNQEATLALGEGVKQAALAGPTMLAEGAANQQPAESTEPDPTAVLQMQQEQTQQAHEASEGEKDRSHELKVIEAEGKRDKEVAKVDATEKIRIEKAKPKPKPAAKPAAKKK